MSGFDKNWLKLREPADREARSQPMLSRVRQHMDTLQQAHMIMDIGCGTGSTYRTVSPEMPQSSWKLLDYESGLLEEAKLQIGQRDEIEFHCQDLNRLDEELLNGVSLVTASALFDLCSAGFCDRFVERLVRRRIGLYAALNYDGIMGWSISHSLDAQIAADFNLHQRFDKGFGPALGPYATAHLSSLFATAGFSVEVAKSPWTLGPSSPELQREFLAGLQKPIREIGSICDADFKAWLEFRHSNIDVAGSLCIVGHTDFLSIPQI